MGRALRGGEVLSSFDPYAAEPPEPEAPEPLEPSPEDELLEADPDEPVQPLSRDEAVAVRTAVTRASSLLPDREEELPPDPRPWEQEILDLHGYTSSEKRTKAERDAIAARILAKTRVPESRLPADIRKIWGRPDPSGLPAIGTAQYLISEWGEERFRGSAVHSQALAQATRERPVLSEHDRAKLGLKAEGKKNGRASRR